MACAAACADLNMAARGSCNALIFIRERKECVLGTALLPAGGEDTDVVYLLPGTGDPGSPSQQI
jgi:hypothetical protein